MEPITAMQCPFYCEMRVTKGFYANGVIYHVIRNATRASILLGTSHCIMQYPQL